jgi:uncharacterized protein (DUF697 family)
MTTKSISSCDFDADNCINVMISACCAAAFVPAQVNWALITSAMGVGVVGIGLSYDVSITKEEAWKLVKQFFTAAGSMWLMLNIGSKMLSMILSATGIGHFGAVVLDVAISGAQAYAVGSCAKEYFRRDYLGKSKPTTQELGKLFRDAFNAQRNK